VPEVAEHSPRALRWREGLGSPLSLYLAAASIGTLCLVDFDVVDYTNLRPQILHHTSDVGRLKLDSAIYKLKAINLFVRIERFDTCLNSQNTVPRHSLRLIEAASILAECYQAQSDSSLMMPAGLKLRLLHD